MISDLLTYAGAQIGREIPIILKKVNLEDVCKVSLEEVQSAYPDAVFSFESSGDLNGRFDFARLQQALSNLLNNAVKYGQKETPITLSATGGSQAVILKITNFGKAIPPESLQVIFNPLIQLPSNDSNNSHHPSTSIGLGLFITREIINGHKGFIDVDSSEKNGTVFTIQLPKN
jgi:hypothetical protein